jgi:UDP-GlcNAc:undecaprenyl-phosphate/decaprenyl-phosphate GlcNAc-1-phosphate transferase
VIAYLWVFLVAFGATFLATPVVRMVVVRIGAIDQPSDRKVHPDATPTMGGIAMWIGMLAALGLSRTLPFFGDMNHGSSEPLAALVTCSLFVVLGAADDRRGLNPLTKVTGQIFIAGVLILMGVQILYLAFPGHVGIFTVGPDLAVPYTILWVVAIVNAVNLVDGLDGLAAGMVAISAGSFFFYMVRTDSAFGEASAAALLSCITAGICLGFLPWNFHPARIFMGDTGAMLLGMLLAISTLSGVARNPLGPTGSDIAVVAIPLLIPLLVLAVPFLDVVLAIARRMRRGIGIAHADKEHIHHRLLEIGHGYRQAVLLMYLWSALIAASGLAVGFITGPFAAGAVLIGAIALFLITALPRITGRRREAALNGEPSASPNGNGSRTRYRAAHAARRGKSEP